MKFRETPLRGAYVIELEKREDDRGFFARFFCQEEMRAAGLATSFVQINNSLSKHRGTLRGLHYQLPPKGEIKLIRCIRGSLYDVILDLRSESPTFGQWFSLELSADNRLMLYVPERFAHGFLTLAPETEALYLVSEFYSPQFERCVRWNDPRFNVKWPAKPEIISPKDMNQADFDPMYHLPA